jgi:hypothetical protein
VRDLLRGSPEAEQDVLDDLARGGEHPSLAPDVLHEPSSVRDPRVAEGEAQLVLELAAARFHSVTLDPVVLREYCG